MLSFLLLHVDIDECALGLLVCSDECINYDGGAYCLCRKGFKDTGDGNCTGVCVCARACVCQVWQVSVHSHFPCHMNVCTYVHVSQGIYTYIV